MCEREITREEAQTLLNESILVGIARYSVRDEKAYRGAEHSPGRWHGWPVGWKEVPPAVFREFRDKGKVSRSAKDRFWHGH